MRSLSLCLVSVMLCAASCGSPNGSPTSIAELGAGDAATAQLVVNGDFEAQTLSPWSTSSYRNSGLLNLAPKTIADLGLVRAALNTTAQVTGPSQGNVLAGLAPTAQVYYPRFGLGAAVINQVARLGQSNSLSTSFVVRMSDLDSVDHKPHLRMVVAPVLENPGHPQNVEAYYFIQATNTSRNNAPLFYQARRSSEPEVPWLHDTAINKMRYTPWQIIDIAADPDVLRIGDAVSLTLLAAACSAGGDMSELYVDAVGATLPGPALSAVGPERVNDGETLAYDLVLSNHGDAQASNVLLRLALPANTTFVSLNNPNMLDCDTPTVGGTGQVVCRLPSLDIAATQSMRLILKVPANATGRVVLGNYTIAAANYPALLGPMLSTNITHAQNYADLSVQADTDAINCGKNQQAWTVTYTNHGPAPVVGAQLYDILPTVLTPLVASCIAVGEATCNGTAQITVPGALDVTANFAPGAQIVCSVIAGIDADTGGQVLYSALVKPPVDIIDNRLVDNSFSRLDAAKFDAPKATAAAGIACAANADCTSGYCVDGVCCSSACTGPCEACAEPGTLGTCTALSGVAPRAGHPTCDGFLCDAGACSNRCESTAQCAGDALCVDHRCIDGSLSLGAMNKRCVASGDCDTGFYCTPTGTCQTPAAQPTAEPNWVVLGAGLPALGCAAAGTPCGLWPWAAGLWLARSHWRGQRHRRRLFGRMRRAIDVKFLSLLLFVACLSPWPARHAQAAVPRVQKSLPADRFAPLAGAGDVHTVQGAHVPQGLTLNGLAMLSYGHNRVRLVSAQNHRRGLNLVGHQGVLDVGLGVSYRQRAQLSVAQSLVVLSGQAAPFMANELALGPKRFGWGDLRLTAKGVAVRHERYALAVVVPLTLPTGQKDNFIGYGGFTAAPGLAAEFDFASGTRLLANVGYALRPRRVLLDADLHNAMNVALGIWLPLRAGNQDLAAQATVAGELGLGSRRRVAMPVELNAGLNWRVREGLIVNLGAGTGLTNGYGAARWRVQTGLTFVPGQGRGRGIVDTRGAESANPLEESLPARPEPVAAAADATMLEAQPGPPLEALPPKAADTAGGDNNPAHGSRPKALPSVPATAPATPLPVPDAYAQADTRPKVIEPRRLAYAPLTQRDMAALEVIAAWLPMAPPSQRIRVSGYAQGRDSRAATRRLAHRRARAAKVWLMAHGVAHGRIDVGEGVFRRHLNFETALPNGG